MNQSSDHDDARVEHPDLDDAIGEDDHGPVFDATFEGVELDGEGEIADG